MADFVEPVMATGLAELRAEIAVIDRMSDDDWRATLNERKIAELRFHDRDRDYVEREQLDRDTSERLYGNRKYYEH